MRSVEEYSVEVVPYDHGWPERYAREEPRVRAALSTSTVDCQHVGSTAVPGLWAKPIVDILVGASHSGPPADDELDALAGLGYVYLGEDGRRPGRFFFRRRDGEFYNLSVVPHGGRLWRENLALRDYLRRTPAAVHRYSATKREAVTAHPDSLLAYQDAKRDMVEHLKTAALREMASEPRSKDASAVPVADRLPGA